MPTPIARAARADLTVARAALRDAERLPATPEHAALVSLARDAYADARIAHARALEHARATAAANASR